MRSYSAHRIGLRAWWLSYSAHRSSHERLQGLVAHAIEAEKFAGRVEGKRILSVGGGHVLAAERYFALRNQVTSIDTDVVCDSFSLRVLVEMLRFNGSLRAFKTAARKALGIDRRYRNGLAQVLRVEGLPVVRCVRGDVCAMGFPADSFDFIYSRSTMQHVLQPEKALSEMARVLVPGGSAYLCLHLYSSFDGAFDGSASWEHLTSTKGGAALNRLRLHDWCRLFRRSWPGSLVQVTEWCGEEKAVEAELLRASRLFPTPSKS